MARPPAALGSIAVAAACAVQACAGPARDRETFIERLGSDTIAIESLRATRNGFEGTVLVRSPETRLLDYWGVREEGRLVEYGVQWRAPGAGPEAPALSATTVRFVGDTALVSRVDSAGVRDDAVWAPDGVVPLPGRIPPPPLLAYAPVGAWREMARTLETPGTAPYLLGLGGGGAPRAGVRPAVRWGDDSIGVRVISGFTVGRLDTHGKLVSISGRGTTVAVEVARAAGDLDLERLALDYAERDRRGEGFGPPSPPARVEATVGGAALAIVYGRPARRGREIWGGLVPYGTVWRTGANLATHFETDRDVVLGETRIPAGRYTLWMIVRRDGGELIVNRDVDIWGTQYAPEHDFARIPLTPEPLAEPVERFTIALDRSGRGEAPEDRAALRLVWDRLGWSTPVRVP